MVDFVFEIIMCVGDGESVEKGVILMEIKGFVVFILLVECVVLNYVGCLIGIVIKIVSFVVEVEGINV